MQETQEINEQELEMFKTTLNKNKDGRFETLKEFTQTEEEWETAVKDLTLFEVITKQMSQIFGGSLYAEEAVALREANVEGTDALINNFFLRYVEECTKEKKLEEIPDLAQIVTWVEEVQFNITKQIWEETFFNNVIRTAIETISEAILETAAEENPEGKGTDVN